MKTTDGAIMYKVRQMSTNYQSGNKGARREGRRSSESGVGRTRKGMRERLGYRSIATEYSGVLQECPSSGRYEKFSRARRPNLEFQNIALNYKRGQIVRKQAYFLFSIDSRHERSVATPVKSSGCQDGMRLGGDRLFVKDNAHK